MTGHKVAKELPEVNISFANLQKIRRIAKQNFSFGKDCFTPIQYFSKIFLNLNML
jgi:hypothetical protein